MRHPLESEREGDDAAAVGAGHERLRLDLGRLGVDRQARLLDRMLGQAVALCRPTVGAAEGEHPGMVAGAVVVDQLGRPALLRAELEVGVRRLGPR